MDGSPPLVYLNGQFLPRSEARLDIEDRGGLFADGVYEVVRYYHGKPFELDRHVQRLRRSLEAISLPAPADVARLGDISARILAHNGWPEAGVYWHITRGPAPRKHLFPKSVNPTVLVMAHELDTVPPDAPLAEFSAILLPDPRWDHCCIKSLMLLPNVLAKNRAAAAGADEAIFHRGDRVTEGTSTNALAVLEGVLRTHPADQWILGGITRDVVLEEARALGLAVVEQTVRVDELRRADEIIVTGSTTQLAAVTHLDAVPVAGGRPGPVAHRLWQAFLARVARSCGR